MPNHVAKQILFATLLFIGYFYIGYFIPRTETLPLFSVFCCLFGVYLWIIYSSKEPSVNQWIIIGIGLRVLLIFSTPALSDDVYRYLWDGRMLANGIHPFANVPEFFFSNKILPTVLNQELYALLNSPPYFTIYPPVAQGVFWLAAKLASNNIFVGIIVIRFFIISAEIGSIILFKKLLEKFNLPSKNILLYVLNPLVILELSGNVHLEAIMIFFLLLTLYFLAINRTSLSAVAFAFAVCSKLIPLIFLPVILFSLKSLKNSIRYTVIVALTCLILFIPLFDWDIISGFNQSFSYYFQKFEFNASVYYLVREWGFWKYGYNIVQTVGWKLGLVSTAGILLYSLSSQFVFHNKPTSNTQQLPVDWLWIYGIYLLFTTILHPWYAIPLLAFSVFTNYRFTVLWTFMIFFTYAGYTQTGYTENLWIVFLEYSLVILYLGYELWKFRSNQLKTSTEMAK